MKSVIIASLNPAKINAVRSAFSSTFKDQSFEFIGVDVSSDVPAQPLSDQETYQGARNRVANAKLTYPNHDFYVGLEAGIDNQTTFAWMVIESQTQRGESRSASLQLPSKVLNKISQQNELGNVMDEVFGTTNIKQQGGAIALLTAQQLTRSSVYHQALILALVPFINPDLF